MLNRTIYKLTKFNSLILIKNNYVQFARFVLCYLVSNVIGAMNFDSKILFSIIIVFKLFIKSQKSLNTNSNF